MLYNIIFYIYEFGIFVASFFSDKVRKMWQGEREAFKVLKKKVDPNAEYAWFHAASLGEFEQGRPIIEEYRRTFPDHKILLTFFSPSGYEVRKDYEGADIVCYLPIDTHTNARRFLRTIRPRVAFFIKYEFWYNYLHILRHRGVPVFSVSSIFRPDQVFFKWYGYTYRHVLKCFTHFFVQNDLSKELLSKLDIHDVTVTGDTRFDRVVQIADQSKVISVVDAFKDGRETFVAGSSWQPDEEIFLPYFNASHPEWKLIIAPHVIEDKHLVQIEGMLSGRKVLRFTKMNEGCKNGMTKEMKQTLADADVLIIDCFGLLSSIYRYGDVAYVGGGFGVGIHNLPEAAVWRLPVIFGPNHQRFQEANELKACGGGFAIKSAEEFKQIMDTMANNTEARGKAAEAAGMYVRSASGATQRILDGLKRVSNIK